MKSPPAKRLILSPSLEFFQKKRAELQAIVFIPSMEYSKCGKAPFPFILERYRHLGIKLGERLSTMLDLRGRFNTSTEIFYSPDKESRKTAEVICPEVCYWSKSYCERSILAPRNYEKLNFSKVVGLARQKDSKTHVIILIRPFNPFFLGKILPHVGIQPMSFKQQAIAGILYLKAQGVETMAWNG